jgi:pSer/pThr/pTyr-binding forkhead associated (FHA) protein
VLLDIRTATDFRRTLNLRSGDALIVGRDPGQCQVCLSDPSVSHRHCRLSVSRTHLWVQDLGSTNGVHINGKRVQSALARPGDTLRIGTCTVSVRESGWSSRLPAIAS